MNKQLPTKAKNKMKFELQNGDYVNTTGFSADDYKLVTDRFIEAGCSYVDEEPYSDVPTAAFCNCLGWDEDDVIRFFNEEDNEPKFWVDMEVGAPMYFDDFNIPVYAYEVSDITPIFTREITKEQILGTTPDTVT